MIGGGKGGADRVLINSFANYSFLLGVIVLLLMSCGGKNAQQAI